MPSSSHPQATFDPIPPDLDLSALVENTPNFDYVIRITSDQIQDLGLEEFEKLVLLHVIKGGRPLVIEGWHKSLPPWLYSPNWLEDNMGRKQENVRDIGNATDMPMTIGHYLGALKKLTKQWTPENFRDPKRQRLYLKDIDCPEAWHQHLQGVIPQILFYLNDCTGEKGGPGAALERNMYNQVVLGNGVGPAGDLMSSLPPDMRAENLMCYIGHEGTYTPTHREMCASLGQNIMVETATAENGEKPGSSIWFMTETKDREVVSEYFLSMLGHDIEVESHFAQINAWKKAPFPVYILEQKLGDFVLIPPLAPHQVWNRGSRTMKVAWNRTTVETLELALHEALPRARMVCRDEQYKNKAIIFYTLDKYYHQLKRVEQAEDASWEGQAREWTRVKQLKKDFKRLFTLYTEILVSETFSPSMSKEKNVEFIPFDSNVTCSYCRCNIFNRFLTCKTCIGTVEGAGDEDAYDVCMECYAMGRSCGCISNLQWVEQWQWSVLTRRYEDWRAMVISNDGFIDVNASPQKLDIARLRYEKKPIAEICQEQLKRRPWRDVTKPPEDEISLESEDEPEVDEEGYVKKKKPTKRKQSNKKSKACHICFHRDWNWKLAFCTTCVSAYCYGVLWRGFDLKPQTVMENPNWKCPKCLKLCCCSKCRRDPNQTPYRPKGTLLGHDTRRVADPRSVESLVDFRSTNLVWLRNEGDEDPHTSRRMQKLVQKAQTEKALDEALGEEHVLNENKDKSAHQDQVDADMEDNMVIDPQLRDATAIYPIAGDCRLPSSSVELNGRARAKSSARYSGGLSGTVENTGIPEHAMIHSNAPDASTFSPDETSYPDSSAPGRDRMMGIGYYQQANDADQILFHHPELATPTEEYPDLPYPKLPHQPENSHQKGKNHERHGICLTDEEETDPARTQFLEAQKKQKLALARKSGTYFMTQNQLEGGQPLVLKLPVSESKGFPRDMKELDEGRPLHRENPRKPRRSVASKRQSSSTTSALDIASDAHDRTDKPNVQTLGDNHEQRIGVATRALQMLEVPMTAFNSTAEIETSITPQKRSHPRESPEDATRNPISEDQPPKSPTPTAHFEEAPTGQAPSKLLITNATEITPETNIVLNTEEAKASSGEEPAKKLNDKKSESLQGSKSLSFVGSYHNPPSALSSPTKKRTAKVGAATRVSEEYLLAKEQALRMVEAEMDVDLSEEDSNNETGANPRASHHAKVYVSPSNAIASAPAVTSNPEQLPTRLLSMAERQALKGKPFKIVAKKPPTSLKPTNRPSPKATSRPSPGKSKVIVRVSLTNAPEDSSAESSFEDDESIPAVRPVAKKPRIESLRGYRI